MIRSELKLAMKEKDEARLSAIRGVMTAITYRNKSRFPIQHDGQIVDVILEQLGAIHDAIEQFQKAERHDLVQKEATSAAYLRLLINRTGVETIEGEELVTLVDKAITAVIAARSPQDKPPSIDDVLKKFYSPGFGISGKAVNKANVIRLVQEILLGSEDETTNGDSAPIYGEPSPREF